MPRIKQLCKLYGMISQLKHLVRSSPSVYQKPISNQTPSFILLKVRCFHGSCHFQARRQSPSQPLTIQTSSSSHVTRLSRHMRNEAQGVLCDYLHSTRNIIFSDAEHISKNSPLFLQILMSKVAGQKDVTHALTKLLHYHPINEFEPFFESLGLTPSEYLPLLPRNMIFLSDDAVLLENYRSLCSYGISRIDIGKIYKEAKEIFECDYGILTTRLQAYENLGLSKPTVIKLVICCPSLLVGGVNEHFAIVLKKLKGLGFETDWVGGYLSGSSTYDWRRVIDTMDFLGTMGFSEDRMSNLLTTDPAFLFGGSGKKIHVLFGRLLKLGLKMDEVYSLFPKNTQILLNGWAQNLLHAVDFLFQIQMGIEDIAGIVSAHHQLLGSSSLKRPRTLRKIFNVNKDSLLCQVIKQDPLKFFSLASNSKANSNEQQDSKVQSKGFNIEKTAFLLSLGYVENSDEMSKALKEFRGRGDQLQERFYCLLEAGLDYETAAEMVRRAPAVLNQNKEVIEKKIDYLINILGYPLNCLPTFPTYLGYNIERIYLRFSMYAWLKKKRSAVNPMLSLSTILAGSEARFMKHFVNIHPEGPDMWKSLKENSSFKLRAQLTHSEDNNEKPLYK